MLPSFCLPPLELCFGTSPIGREVSPRSESARIGNAGDKRGGERRPDIRNVVKAPKPLTEETPRRKNGDESRYKTRDSLAHR